MSKEYRRKEDQCSFKKIKEGFKTQEPTELGFFCFSLAYNCFKIVCWFLLYNEIISLNIHISLASWASLHPSPHRHSSSQSTELSSLCNTADSCHLSVLYTVNVYIVSADVENSAVATGLEMVSFYSNPKERQCQRMLKLLDNCTHLTH